MPESGKYPAANQALFFLRSFLQVLSSGFKVKFLRAILFFKLIIIIFLPDISRLRRYFLVRSLKYSKKKKYFYEFRFKKI